MPELSRFFGLVEKMMFPRVIDVRHLRNHILELTFADGIQTEMDFAKRIMGRGGVFASLEDVSFFKQVKVDPEAGTLVWPNEVDFDPDVLYNEATGEPITVAEAPIPG
jgi:hypothetical protein